MEDKLNKLNNQINEGKLIITDEKILNTKKNRKENVDATTSPTMTTLFIQASKKYQEQKANPKE